LAIVPVEWKETARHLVGFVSAPMAEGPIMENCSTKRVSEEVAPIHDKKN